MLLPDLSGREGRTYTDHAGTEIQSERFCAMQRRGTTRSFAIDVPSKEARHSTDSPSSNLFAANSGGQVEYSAESAVYLLSFERRMKESGDMLIPCQIGFKDLIFFLWLLALFRVHFDVLFNPPPPRCLRSVISECPSYVRVWIASLMELRQVPSMSSQQSPTTSPVLYMPTVSLA